ncbi:Cro/Cl family transcriptional regulator [Cupriavidus sp. 2TAF22]|uniref:Cro/Cl family transcriptional regulator n=1 Tax=unclassified Cupriavidus TaxID=2640874 RepID=UPI003F8DAB49
MDKLLAYLNSLDRAQRAAFCNALGTSEGYLRKAISAGGRFKCELCVLIERHAEGRVTRKDLRADWPRAWPELFYVEPRLWLIPVEEWLRLLAS